MTARTSPITIDGPRFEGTRLVPNSNSKLWHTRVMFRDFSAAATTGNKDITGFGPNVMFEGAFAILGAVFAGGAVSACTLSIGTTSSATAYMVAKNVFTGATAPDYLTGATAPVPGTFLGTINAVGTVRIQVVTTTANTSALTAGYCDIYLKVRAVGRRPS